MQEGLAFVCLITSAMTVDRAKIVYNIPKKGKADDTQRKKVRLAAVKCLNILYSGASVLAPLTDQLTCLCAL